MGDEGALVFAVADVWIAVIGVPGRCGPPFILRLVGREGGEEPVGHDPHRDGFGLLHEGDAGGVGGDCVQVGLFPCFVPVW